MSTPLAVGGSAASVQDPAFAERRSIDDLHAAMISATHVKEISCMLTQESQLTMQITSQNLGMRGT